MKEPSEVKSIVLYDLAGKQMEMIGDGRVAKVQTMGSLLTRGIYILKVNGVKRTQTLKVIKD